ncbi:MAG: ATP-binding protein, partial [Lentisphaeraceae bacterium]|nr:ATP-binding protein [Lentisphaeraceae bacterium]
MMRCLKENKAFGAYVEKECQKVEWKQCWQDDYLKWICAFANGEGGILEIGRDDTG